jgi:hypothetical protein
MVGHFSVMKGVDINPKNYQAQSERPKRPLCHDFITQSA